MIPRLVLGGYLLYLLALQPFLCLYFIYGFTKVYKVLASGVTDRVWEE